MHLWKNIQVANSQSDNKEPKKAPSPSLKSRCLEIFWPQVEKSKPVPEEPPGDNSGKEVSNLPKPHRIKEILDQYVVGQERAKKALSVAVYNHYKRISLGMSLKDEELQKSNILMIGPTGCGKTLLAQTLAKILNVPYAIADATSLTEAGYVGEDVENILLKLIQAANYDIKKAEKGIIYLDEVDKISRKSGNPSITRDVSGEGVQQALLKILEGTEANVPPNGGRKHPHQQFLKIDTTNILFICGGAFEGIETLVKRRIGENGIGFGADISSRREKSSKEVLSQIIPQDLLSFGLIPEFVGRLPIIVTLEPLDESSLVSILTSPKNALANQYKKIMEMEGVSLEFKEDALRAIAGEAFKRNMGARGLRAVMEDIMLDIMFDIPSLLDISKVIITRDVVEKKQEPILIRDNQKTAEYIGKRIDIWV